MPQSELDSFYDKRAERFKKDARLNQDAQGPTRLRRRHPIASDIAAQRIGRLGDEQFGR